ncbi:MAG: hypothetical protein ACAI38_12705 [Myxococcota bacterium]
MNRWRLALVIVAWVAPLVTAKADEGALERAKRLHRDFAFAPCLATLDVAGAEENTPARLAEVELYRGLCAYGLSRRSAAVDHFQTAVKLNPAIDLPPLTSPRIRQFFESAVAGHRSSGPREPPSEPAPSPPSEAPPAASVAIEDNRPPPARRLLPWVTAGVAAAGTLGYAVLGIRARNLASDANAARFQDDALASGDRARTSARLASVSLGVAVAAAVATVLLWPDAERPAEP